MKYTTWKILGGYLVLLLLLATCGTASAQTLKIGGDVTVVHFNAGWNSAADVKWVSDLNDCKIATCDIATDTKAASKHEIVVVPTIIVYKDGEEIKRFQADISFAMKATLKDVQEVIDEIIMDSF